MRGGHFLQLYGRGVKAKASSCTRAAVVVVALSTGSSPAWAQPNVSVQVPDECGSKDAFLAELRALEHADVRLEALTLAVHIERSNDGGYELRLTLPDDTRELTDPDCATLFKTAVVIAAASIPEPAENNPAEVASNEQSVTPNFATKTEPASAPRTPKEPTTPRPARQVSVTNQEPLNERNGTNIELHLGAGAVLGATPKLAFGSEVGGLLVIERWVLSAITRYVPPTTTDADTDVRMRTFVWEGRVGAGYEVTSKIRCQVGLSALWVRGRAVGIRYPEADSVWVLASELELAVQVAQWDDFGLDVALQGRISLNAPRFEVEPDSVVFAVPRVGASGFFRVKWAP